MEAEIGLLEILLKWQIYLFCWFDVRKLILYVSLIAFFRGHWLNEIT